MGRSLGKASLLSGRSRLPVGHSVVGTRVWPYLASSRANTPGRTKDLLKITFPQVPTCSLFPSHFCKQGSVLLFLSSCSLQLWRKTVTTALVRDGSGASRDSWWHEEPMHLLFSLCQASLNNVRSCVRKNDVIGLPTVGPKLCTFFK